MMPDKLIDHLRALVSFDTQDPPREIEANSPIIEYCKSIVGDCEVKIEDHGEGRVSFFARRGNPSILFNVHLDTVAAGPGWSSPPLEMRIEDQKAYGRGTCDIKGAAAALLTLFQESTEDMALLFTTDEEGGGGCAVAKFLETKAAKDFTQVVVAEPTECKPIAGHRGFLGIKIYFDGTPGHSSESRALHENANHQMIRWASNVLDLAQSMKSDDSDPASCLNLGLINGGTKSNVIAGNSFVHLSARLPPGSSTDDFIARLKDAAPSDSKVKFDVSFRGEPLPAQGQNDSAAKAFCQKANVSVASPVDFWTEASLFSAAGLPAIVLGPGNIEQAHAIDEWVSLSQLESAYTIYREIVSNDQ